VKRIVVIFFSVFFVFGLYSPQVLAETDEQIKQKLIQHSIEQYPGNCPCPYNTDRAGRRCGGRSAYNRAGGYSPLCYPNDVTQKMVDQYKVNRPGGDKP
jgi:hypothetical protein